ncbi:MAG: Gfo/Idh/MocA family protein, partial [Flavobacteriales bacterium]
MKLEKNNKLGNNNRRNFIKKTGVSIGSMMFIPSHVLFSKKEVRDAAGQITQKAVVVPSDKVNLACCGIGNRGGAVIRDLYATGAANVVALCDVNLDGEKSQKSLGAHPSATRYNDFRKMFEEMEGKIDAVSVGTPDFSHFPITILAMSLGKHVYVEKPLTRTFQESELLIKAAKKYGVATQMGNQGHCQDNYYQFKSWVENG